MRKYPRLFAVALFLTTLLPRLAAGEVSLKAECRETLFVLVDRLLAQQINDQNDPNFGALCSEDCRYRHTRAGEAVYPFAVAYKHSGDEKYRVAAKNLANWLFKQQQPDGAWKETPEAWTGTTTDQLLMLSNAFPLLRKYLSSAETEAWLRSIRQAADYLAEVMRPEFASINYCATTTATLAITGSLLDEPRYTEKARQLAAEVIARFDEDGFLTGEGGRIRDVKYGVDLAYAIDMSLWGLALYARETGDSTVANTVRKSLKTHLYFVYPNGSIDGSWGIRSNKWTTYGSQTADGCQILFSLFAPEDGRYRTAALRNLRYLRGMVKDGWVGYGPDYWRLFDDPPSIYPTFARAKNLAMAVEMGEQQPGETPPLPTDETGWAKLFPTVDVVLARSENLMATISAYRYKDVKRREKSKYMHRPTGGSICNLWVKNHGFLQTSSQTIYHRWEPMHFPEASDIRCLTPRIEFEDAAGNYYTNLYEFDGRISLATDLPGAVAEISTAGELKDATQYSGGIAYRWTHRIFDDGIEKTVYLRYHGRKSVVRIVEPIVRQPGMTFEKRDERTVMIYGKNRVFRMELLDGAATVESGTDADNYWFPFPSIKCYPVVLRMEAPHGDFKQKLRYRLTIIDE